MSEQSKHTAEAINALADQVESLTEPDRSLDRAIHRQFTRRLVSDETFIYSIGLPANKRVLTYAYTRPWLIWWAPKYTRSLDAAAASVRRWMHWDAGELNQDDSPWACVTDSDGNDFAATGATPALALTAASLRALAGERP